MYHIFEKTLCSKVLLKWFAKYRRPVDAVIVSSVEELLREEAAEKGDVHAVRRIPVGKAHADGQNTQGQAALHLAAAGGYLRVVEALCGKYRFYHCKLPWELDEHEASGGCDDVSRSAAVPFPGMK